MGKTKEIFLKLKAKKFYILNQFLYWKDSRGVLLNYLLEDEAHKVIEEFHKGYCGGHHFWKATTNKILRPSFC